MLFNSIEFAVFFIVVYGLYLCLSHRWQNRMLLVASYLFYSWWDWRFLSLILFSTVLDYVCGLRIASVPTVRKKRFFLVLSIIGNLSLLGFFKYYGFFVESLALLLAKFNIIVPGPTLHVILPVGISFYTFQTMSYTLDIYRGEISPTHRLVDFALFVAFFPQLVAGPIERAKNLLPQILNPRSLSWEKFSHGCYLIFYGLFQKIFIADNLARIVDPVFSSSQTYNGISVLLAVYAFAFQIFCDFAGYSNIARGLAKCLGIDLMVNFRLVYFATNPQEFWRRWHISLSTWLRDYLYYPMGGNRRGRTKTYRNLIITMLLGGLWHGANWTFLLWGLYHGLLLVIHRAYFLVKGFNGNDPNPAFRVIKILFWFHFVCFGWLLFRAQSIGQFQLMVTSVVGNLRYLPQHTQTIERLSFFVAPLLLIQLAQAAKRDLLVIYHQHWVIKTFLYALMAYFMMGWGLLEAQEFIYFQF